MEGTWELPSTVTHTKDAETHVNSDTTSATITYLFYELALNPALTEKVYEELREVDVNSSEVLSKLTLFNAVINETLRLHPVLPSALYRETPPRGLVVGDTFVPGNTKILAPRWTISRRKCRQLPCSWQYSLICHS